MSGRPSIESSLTQREPINRPSTSVIDDSDDNSWTTKIPSVGSETIVKLRRGDGPPLIIIHGVGGTIHGFSPLKRHFSSPLWAIQITPDTPLQSVEVQGQFYFEKIKIEQPTGPYRICGFSASTLMAVYLVQLLEKNGDTVSQLSFIDHFPTVLLAPVIGLDVSTMSMDHPHARQIFGEFGVRNFIAVTRRDGRGNNPRRHKLADDVSRSYSGLPTSPFIENFRAIFDQFINVTFNFFLKLEQESRAAGEDLPGMEFLDSWLKLTKAPVSAYLATYGMLQSVTSDKHPPEDWYDFGIHRSFPNAKITVFEAGHCDILGHPGLARGLQEGYITERARL